MNNFFKLMFKFSTSKQRAAQIKADPQKQPTSFRFAILSIIPSILMVLCSALTLLLGAKPDSVILYIMMLIFVIAIGFAGPLVCLTNALVNLSLQFSINKNWSSWTALVVLLLAIGGSVTLIIIGLGAL